MNWGIIAGIRIKENKKKKKSHALMGGKFSGARTTQIGKWLRGGSRGETRRANHKEFGRDKSRLGPGRGMPLKLATAKKRVFEWRTKGNRWE